MSVFSCHAYPSHPLSSSSPHAFNLSQHHVFSSESVLHIRWPKYWSFSFSISPSNEYSGLISFRIDWFDLLAVQGTLKSLLQHHSSKASILQCSAFFIGQLSHPYMTTEKMPSPPLALFVVMLPKVHLISNFRMSGSRSDHTTEIFWVMKIFFV